MGEQRDLTSLPSGPLSAGGSEGPGSTQSPEGVKGPSEPTVSGVGALPGA